MSLINRLIAGFAVSIFAIATFAPVIAEEAAAPTGGSSLFGSALDDYRSEIAKKYGLDLKAPDELLGVVVDENEQAVPGATVYLRVRGWWDAAGFHETTADERGQFVFSDLGRSKYNIAAVKGPLCSRTQHHQWQRCVFKRGLEQEPIVVRVKRQREVKVSILDAETGKPIPGSAARGRYWGFPPSPVDDAGHAVVQGVYTHPWGIEAFAPGYTMESEELQTGSADVELSFRLKPGAQLAGIVTNQQGQPLRKVSLRLTSNAGYHAFCWSKKDGSYKFPYAPAETSLTLRLGAPNNGNYLDASKAIDALQRGSSTTRNWMLEKRPPGGSVSGKITGRDGKPLQGAKIVNHSDVSNRQRTVHSTADGQFVLHDVYKSHRGHELMISAKSHIGRIVKFTPGTPEDPAEVAVALKPGNTLRGLVVNEAGDPIAGARVSFGELFFGLGEQAWTDKQGRFAFDSLPEGPRFDFRAKGYSDISGRRLPINSDDEVEVVMLPAGLLRGRALNAKTQQPIDNFNVRIAFSPQRKASDPSGGISTTLINPGTSFQSTEGHFELGNLILGMPFMVTVEAEGYRPATLARVETLRAEDASRSDFRLEPTTAETLTTVAGRLVLPNDAPAAGVTVALLTTLNGKTHNDEPYAWRHAEEAAEIDDRLLQVQKTISDRDGHFRFEGVYADKNIEILCRSERVALTRRSGIEKLQVSEQADIEIQVLQAACLTVTVDKQALAGAERVGLTPITDLGHEGSYDHELQAWRPNDAGQWRITSITPGNYRLTISKSERLADHQNAFTSKAIHQQKLTLATGEDRVLHVQEPRLDKSSGQSFWGRLRSAMGRAAEAAAKKAPRPAEVGE